MAKPAVHQVLDAKGLKCPMPILKAKKAMDGLAVGQVLQVIATDPGSMADFRSWTRQTGQELLGAEAAGGLFTFLIRKLR